ncbi:putative secreted lipase [Psilocybe cubensis]|uniref:AB hydrolase-1 domain-containing protein n=2 Tax=Psilocybe cubensis TaxID=181762 RepID=A0A8H7XVY9_PSICU|nr:putative secreted lipase [Psilocybe cubensis]KAH9482117.1 putative secreted lipase [Psilocybe cubensis]
MKGLFSAFTAGLVARANLMGNDLKGQTPPIANGVLHKRSYFYVGGAYEQTAGTFIAGSEVTVSSGQMYVEHLVPSVVTQKLPIVIIPGNGMTGTNFLNTPDGRTGWADYFMSQGYELYLVDQPSRGRSPWQQNIDGPQMTFDVLTVEQRFTDAQRFQLWPQAHLHTQWPGNGSRGDPTFDNFYMSIVPALASDAEASAKVKNAGSALLDRVGPAIVLTHSQSGQFGWILADARPSLVKAIVAIEPIGPPFINAVFPPLASARPFGLTEIPVEFTPPIESASDLNTMVVSSTTNFTCIQQASPPRKLANVSKVPVLVVTSESSYHAVYDSCSVDFLKAAGVSVDHVNLQDVGILGNGHMMFMEKNGLDIADRVVNKWLKQTV